jgi:mono/diheme cytochrome c family protein
MALLRKCLGSLLALAALAGARAADAAPAAARGEVLVGRHCAACHAVGRGGDSPEPAAPRFRELNRRYDPGALQEALAEGLLTGHPMMPEFRFEPDDVRSIILYLDSIQNRQSSSRARSARPGA